MTLEEAADKLGIDLEETLDRMVGKRELLIRLLKYFAQEQNFAEIEESVSRLEHEKTANLLHTMKGSALSLGCVSMADKCHNLVVAIRNGQEDRYTELYQAVREEFYRSKEIIDRLDS